MSKKRGVRGGSSGKIGAASGRVQAADKVSTGVAGLRDATMWALLYLAALAAYWPALHGDMLWDDGSHITSLRLQSLQGLGRIWFEPGATQQYYPLLHSAFWIEHLLWGDSVLGYHLVNVTLHAASAGLVVTIMRRLSLPGSWLAGFIFALHPVCVEAVAWISEQKSTLSGVFCLAAAVTYLHFDQKRRISLYIAATGLFIMALLTKSVTATLPASLLILFWWQRGRIDYRRDVAPLLPWFALGASMGLFTAWVERTYIGAKGAGFDDISPLQRFLLACRVPWFYAGKVLWPVNLTFSYPRWQVDAAQWWQYLFPAGVVAALGMALFVIARSPRSRKSRGPLASFLIFIATLFPVLGFLNVYPFRYSFVADHFQYLASLAIIVPASYLLMVAAARWLPGKAIATAVLAALLVVPGALTWRQSHNYSDSETLYRATLANNPDSWLAHINLGRILHVQPGRLQDAIAEYEAAVRIDPDRAEAYTDLGDALALTPGRMTDAIAAEKTALRLQPGLAAAHGNLGKILAQMPGRMPEALAEFKTAIRLDPGQPEMHYNLGTAFMNTPGRLPDAIAEFKTAIGIDPDYVEAHYNLAACLSRMPGRESDAIAEFEAALRIRPDFEPAEAALQRMRPAGR